MTSVTITRDNVVAPGHANSEHSKMALSNRRQFLRQTSSAAAGLCWTQTRALAEASRFLEARADNLDPALRQRIERMPKAEIHVHLEGTMTPDTVWNLAEKNRVRLPAASLESWKQYYAFRDFSHFIEVYVAASGAIAKPEDFTHIVAQFAAQQEAQNVLYSEVFLSASLHLERFHDEAIIDALQEGIRLVSRKHGVRLLFIPDIARERPQTQQRVLDFTLKGRDKGIFVGLSLAGQEAGYPPELFRNTFAEAQRKGLHVVAHAGEVVGPSSIWAALDCLHAERIGHGIRCLEDPLLVARLKNRRIPLEVCPVSNYRTGAISPSSPHPIRSLVERGLRCTLNSDDPPMFGTDLINEYCTLAAQGFAWRELWALNRATLDATFLDEGEHKELSKGWEAFENAQG
jgi:adenosine deaminase